VYFLNEGKKDTDLLKSIFEFRLLCEIGLLPKLLGCCECCVCEHDEMHFDFITNSLTCGDCYKEKENGEESINETVMDRTMLYIVRFIALTDYERLFSFRISEQYQERVTEFTERFVSYHLKGKFVTLDFYKTIK
jgi:DNA repair protein RecO (recombination protein O)